MVSLSLDNSNKCYNSFIKKCNLTHYFIPVSELKCVANINNRFNLSILAIYHGISRLIHR